MTSSLSLFVHVESAMISINKAISQQRIFWGKPISLTKVKLLPIADHHNGLLVCFLVRPFIRWFVRCLSIRSFVYSSIRSFVHPFVLLNIKMKSFIVIFYFCNFDTFLSSLCQNLAITDISQWEKLPGGDSGVKRSRGDVRRNFSNIRHLKDTGRYSKRAKLRN